MDHAVPFSCGTFLKLERPILSFLQASLQCSYSESRRGRVWYFTGCAAKAGALDGGCDGGAALAQQLCE